MWNNPIDTNMWTAPGSNEYLSGADTPPSDDSTSENQQIPHPGGFLHSNQEDFNEPFTNMNIDGQGNVDLSQFNTECDIVFDINHGTVFLPNPNWDGISTGPLTTDLAYYDEDGEPVNTAPPNGPQGPFLLPGFVINPPTGSDGDNESLRPFLGEIISVSESNNNFYTYTVKNTNTNQQLNAKNTLEIGNTATSAYGFALDGSGNLEEFPGFQFLPVPIGTHVIIINNNGSFYFSAPNPIIGSCS
jgi:hypothetical protein